MHFRGHIPHERSIQKHYIINNDVMTLLVNVILICLSLTEYDSERVQEEGVRKSECARI